MRTRQLAVLVLAGLCAVGASAPQHQKPRAHTITIERMRFEPQSLLVAPGDTIVWINKDLVPHTATSKTAGFDSKTIQANASWKYTVRKKGTYGYTCTFHPTMSGTVRVR